MDLYGLQVNNTGVSQAYQRSSLFDMVKKGDIPENELENKKVKAKPTPIEVVAPKEVVKPNTIPFKPGNIFEYDTDISSKESVKITITTKEQIKVQFSNVDSSNNDEQKKTINSIVRLSISKISKDDFNNLIDEEKISSDNIKKELTLMGLDTTVPFGIGDFSFYLNDDGLFNSYKAVDLKG